MKYGFLILLLCIPLSSAATITGTIYDYSLQPVPGAVIQINTIPEQTLVAQEGTYKLEVPAGEYTLKVSKASGEGLEEKAEANITVPTTGTFTYDLILFQELQEFEEPALDNLIEEPATISPLILLAILFVVIGLIVFTIIRMKKKIEREIQEEDELAGKIFLFIKKEKRTTQKNIRKQFPYAEATISLVLTSLEHEKKITKVKKGRSNVILYNKAK